MTTPASRSFLSLLAVLASASACGARTGLDLPALDAGFDAPPLAEAAPLGCGPSSCSGCCDDAGACQAGSTLQACGIGGSACQACDPAFDVCNPRGDPNVTGVVCYEPCPLRTCTGCCTPAGACVDGNADTACGGPFRVCADCTALGQSCVSAGSSNRCM
jgi:hypothetical protein